MRTALTLAYPHDGSPARLIAGPGPDIEAQKRAIKEMRGSREHVEFARVEMWTSGEGLSKRATFDKPGLAPVIKPAPAESKFGAGTAPPEPVKKTPTKPRKG